MSSLFSNEPENKPAAAPAPYSADRLGNEVSHLQKRTSSRHARQEERHWLSWLGVLVFVGLLWLYFMDPVLHSFHRADAIRDYLYLHNSGSDKKARELANSGIFTPNEIEMLNHKIGSYQDYYANEADAEKTADEIIAYMHRATDLRAGNYGKLDAFGKVRYQLFVRFGLVPPMKWQIFDPSVG